MLKPLKKRLTPAQRIRRAERIAWRASRPLGLQHVPIWLRVASWTTDTTLLPTRHPEGGDQ
ncbi:MAG: hypothetical protein PVSMB7_30400 [Chloroflexota bacterium]